MWASQEQSATDLVEFSTSLSDKALTIECKPRSQEIGRADEWVDQCNALGRTALDEAAASGKIAPVAGPAFGMASEFIKQLPASASMSERAMSRDIPLVSKSS
ncbi:MAG: hypothetical protein CVV14_02320 [Gammaproteobacteria bacterium HGW-Gammaproteobacteria-4]|nr:MAG: hypothetical protein CVV14_02320 [Gammaproteobacteria bacterium HGW-Gammaproteobacteria-4]